MLPFVAQRVAALALVLLAVSVLVFAILRLIPGDPAALIAGVDARPEEVERLRVVLGLDQPAYVQYARYLGRVITGDLGRSLRSQEPVATDLATRFEASLLLASVSLVIALAVGLPIIPLHTIKVVVLTRANVTGLIVQADEELGLASVKRRRCV